MRACAITAFGCQRLPFTKFRRVLPLRGGPPEKHFPTSNAPQFRCLKALRMGAAILGIAQSYDVNYDIRRAAQEKLRPPSWKRASYPYSLTGFRHLEAKQFFLARLKKASKFRLRGHHLTVRRAAFRKPLSLLEKPF